MAFKVFLHLISRYVFGVFLSWDWLALVCGFVPLLFLVLIIFMPESVRYLLTKGHVTEAKEALRWLRGARTAEDVEDELNMVNLTLFFQRYSHSK